MVVADAGTARRALRYVTRRTRRRLAALAALVVVLAAGAFLLVRGGDDGAEAKAAVAAFAAAWSRGGDGRAGALTDSPAAASALKANRAGLDGARVTVRPGPLQVKDGRATGRLRIAWRIPAIGAFAYSAPVSAVKAKDRWLVHFSPRTIHPRLTASTRLGTDSTSPPRAGILDRDGRPLVRERAVVRVGLQRDKVTDVAASAGALARALGLDSGALAKAVRGAGPKQFVEAQTLRKADYEREKADLDGIPGLLTVDGTAPLAPTRAFARALLGGVGPATAEQVKRSEGRLAPGQQTGQWGLEQVYDGRLAGAPARRILIRDRKTGAPVATLRKLAGHAPRALRTTLS